MTNEMTIALTDADYQLLERQMAAEMVALRRENVVLNRVINELRAAWAKDRQRMTALETHIATVQSGIPTPDHEMLQESVRPIDKITGHKRSSNAENERRAV